MNDQAILEELLALLETNEVTIRNEPLGGSGGGLCTVKGRPILFVDTQAPAIATATICAEAIVKVLDIEQIYMKPQVRRFIEDHRDAILRSESSTE